MNNKLIAINTVVSYGRSILSAGLTVFSTRWVLDALGKADYGLFFAVGAVVAFLGFINASMSLSTQRHLAYAIGCDKGDEVRAWFNAAFSLHLVISFLFVLLAVPVGCFAFAKLLTIPEGRFNACICVYVCSVVVAAVAVVSVPYNALYIAKQRIYELTIIQSAQAILMFVFSWVLLFYTGDRLIFYAVGSMLANVVVYVVQIFRCVFIFEETRLDLCMMRDYAKCKALLSFSGWSLASTIGFIVRGQGIALVLNNFGTSGSNAAYSIANNIASQTGFLANGFMHAISPEITSAEGAGNRSAMIALATRSSKYAVALVLFIVLPLYTDAEALLGVWLKEVPEYTPQFVRIVMVMFIAIQAVLGVSVANKAFGKIALPQTLAAACLIFAIPLAFAVIRFGLSLVFVVSVVSITQIMCVVTTLYSARKLFGYPVMDWFRDVFCRNIVVVAVCLALSLIVHIVMPSSFIRFMVISLCDAFVIVGLGFFVLLSPRERTYLIDKIRSLLRYEI